MGPQSVTRRNSAAAAAVVTAALCCPPAGAVVPPVPDAQTAPPVATPGPPQPMAQRSPCSVGGILPGSDPAAGSPNQLTLNLSHAWRLSRGEGTIVAVIDTGVQPGPRLPNVDPGGDFVAATDGLTDCDGHGTLVAGLIAGQPGPDGFSGVAPAARLVAIRQTSAKYAPRLAGDDPALARAGLDITSLARSVVRAADLGARVITISSVTCLPADNTLNQSELGAALKYAAVDKDAVIVAAAGDAGAGASCESNPPADPARPDDPRNWAGVQSVSVPSWWQPYVLSVGSLRAGGGASDFCVAGPWVGIAAPGEDIVSLSNAPGGGLANGLAGERQDLIPVAGTSYAAAYVAGVAALVRSRFPDLTATQVVHRLTATASGAARSPSNLVGAGAVDPLAALTWVVPTDTADTAAVRQLAAPAPSPQRDTTPRTVAFVGTGLLAVAVLSAAIISAHRRKEPQR